MSDERTIEPSRRRIEQSRAQGQSARSRELTAAASLLAMLAAGHALGDDVSSSLLGLLETGRLGLVPEPSRLVNAIAGVAGALALPLIAILSSGWLAGVLVHQLQTGGSFVPSLALPDSRRLRRGLLAGGDEGTAAGFVGRLWPQLGRSTSLLVVAAIGFASLRARWAGLLAAISSSDATALQEVGSVIVAVSSRIALTLLALGVVDFAIAYQRWWSRLRTTPEEARDERRATEGDAGVRTRRVAAGRHAPRPHVAGASGVGMIASPVVESAP